MSGQRQAFADKNPLLRTAVLILGMHRSGTSAFARVANLLGCDLPLNLMPPDEGNALGHWESNSVTALNERLLASMGSKWDDWTPLNERWSQSTITPTYLAEAEKVLRDDFGNSPLFVLKDPRICRLAPFWLKAIEGLGVRSVIALPLRNPYEVSNSLASRDGSDQGFGLLLWLRHVLEAEAATRHLPRYFFTFDQLLADWRQVIDGLEEATDTCFPRRSVAVEAEIATFLTEDARHERESNTTALSTAAPVWVSDTYAILKRWCESGVETDDFDRLDAIRAEFNAASPSFAQIIAKGVLTHGGYGAGAQARAALEEAHQKIEQLKPHAAEAAQARVALEQAHSEIERLKGEEAQAAELRDALARTTAEVEQLKPHAAEAAQARVALEQAHSEIERLQLYKAEADHIRAELVRTQNELEQAQFEAVETASARIQIAKEMDSLSETNLRMEAEIAKLNSVVRQRQEEATQAWAKAETEQALRERIETELTRLIRQNEDLVARFATIDDRIRAEATALVAARRRASDAESALGQMNRQQEKLLAELETKEDELRRAQSLSARADNELAQLAKLHMNAQERVRELEEIVPTIDVYRARVEELEELATSINAYKTEIATLSERANAAEQAGHQTQALLIQQQSDIYLAQETLANERARVDAMARQAEWLQEATTILQRKPRLRALFSSSARQQYSRAQLKAAGLFDAEAYLHENPDVARSGEDPLLHYVRHGLREGRKW